MTTSIDTNVVVALWNSDDVLNLQALSSLKRAHSKGELLISGVVYAELLASPGMTETLLTAFLEDTSISVDWNIKSEIWIAAGTAFGAYAERRRKAKQSEPRRILADFLIGAHALENKYFLLTMDDRTFRSAFPKLKFAERV